MRHFYEYTYADIVLKPIGAHDIEALRILRNHARQFFLNMDKITREEQARWYETYQHTAGDYMFKVEKTSAPGTFLGAIAVYHIDGQSGTAEVGRIVIDKAKAPEKGVGADAIRALCLFAFDELKLKRLRAVIKKTNPRSYGAFTHAGFVLTDDLDPENNILELTREHLRV